MLGTQSIFYAYITKDTYIYCTVQALHYHYIIIIIISLTYICMQSDSESEALSIVSYIGCGISIACLLFTIVVLIVLRQVLPYHITSICIYLYRKQVFNHTQHFIHLNLSIALLLGLVIFVSGIEAAAEHRVSYEIIFQTHGDFILHS